MTAAVYGDEPGGHPAFNSDSQAAATSGVIKASAGVFFEANGYNLTGNTRYFHVYNSATVPTDGAVPALVPVAVPPYGVFSLTFEQGVFFDTGISWACSTGVSTKTLSTADLWVTITYR